MIDEVAKDWRRGAIVYMEARDGFTMTRPAVWVWDTPNGFAFVEPSYASPDQPAPFALHRIQAELEQRGTLVGFTGPEWSGSIEADDGIDGDASAALAWYLNVYLPGVARTLEEEAVRMGIKRLRASRS